MEIWKDIPGFEGLYQASNEGRIRSLTRQVYNYIKPGRILKSNIKNSGYLYLSISNGNNKFKHANVHRLVALAFIPNPDSKPQVNHKDGNRLNNNVDNLEWCTAKENINHSLDSRRYKIGLQKKKETRERSFDLKVFKYKDEVVNLYDSHNTVETIASMVGIGRDFVTRILRMHGRLK